MEGRHGQKGGGGLKKSIGSGKVREDWGAVSRLLGKRRGNLQGTWGKQRPVTMDQRKKYLQRRSLKLTGERRENVIDFNSLERENRKKESFRFDSKIPGVVGIG